MSESLTELLRGFLLALPYLVAIDYDVVVVGYPANPNGAKEKAFLLSAGYSKRSLWAGDEQSVGITQSGSSLLTAIDSSAYWKASHPRRV